MRTTLLVTALMILTPLTAFATMNSTQVDATHQLETALEVPQGFETSHAGCSGDQSTGGCHLATDEWWQRTTYDVTVQDSDGDGIPNSADRFPHDPAMPTTAASNPRLSCSADNRLPCLDEVGASIMDNGEIYEFEGLAYAFSAEWIDIDLDGDLDISIADAASIKIFLNDAGAFSSDADLVLTATNNKAVFTQGWADVDRDGDLDLMMGNWPEIDWNLFTTVAGTSGANELYLNDGDTFSGPVWSAPDSGNNTMSVSWADVNGDGWMDVAFGNTYMFDTGEEGPVDFDAWELEDRIFLNDGTGALETSPWWTSGTELPTDNLQLADIDGDGDVDMISTSEQFNAGGYIDGGFLHYYENDQGFAALPTWTNSSDLSIATRPAPSLADFDGDGDLDIALSGEDHTDHPDLNHSKVLRFDTTGFEQVPVWRLNDSQSDEMGAIEWLDYDSDGDYDLLVVTDADDPEFCLFRNEDSFIRSNPNLASCVALDNDVASMSMGDFDNDGDQDTLFISMTGVSLWVNSAQTLSQWRNSMFAAQELLYIDSFFDADGDQLQQQGWNEMGELVQYYDEPRWALGDLTSVEFSDLDTPSPSVGDLEVIISRRSYSPAQPANEMPVTYYIDAILGGGTTDAAYPIDLNNSLSAMAVGDLDNDGDMDILGAGDHEYFTTYLREVTCINDCNNRLEFNAIDWNTTSFQNFGVVDIALGDVNDDGYLDAALAFEDWGIGLSTPAFCIYLNSQNGSFASDPASCSQGLASATSVDWNDYDDDGDIDLAVGVETPSSAVLLYRNDGGGQMTRIDLPHPNCQSSCQIHAVDWHDVDGDGDEDLIAGPDMNRIAVFYNMNGVLSTQFSSSTNTVVDSRDFAWADIDFDGWQDLVVAVRSGGDAVFRNVGGVLSDSPMWTSSSTATTIRIGAWDLDLDGGIELLGMSDSEVWSNGVMRDNDRDFIEDMEYQDLEGDKSDEDRMPFDPTQWQDDDLDGFGENAQGMTPDSCVNVYGESWRDRWGCTDEDSDGQSNLYDDFWIKDTQWTDSDGDGLGDNWGDPTWTADREAHWPGEFIPNAYNPDENPLDFDNDGYENANLFPIGTSGDFDNCPQVYGVSSEDLFGCPDMDLDGWSDFVDEFPGDGSQWNDTDGDGYGDNGLGTFPDECPTQAGNSTRDVFGCIDSDGDGWSSLSDFDDDDGWEWSDLDGDGFGDNLDECQYDAGDVTDFADIGCPDGDGDGVADRSDAFPNLIWHWEDADEDGIGDNQNAPNGMYDSCPDEAGTSHRMQVLGCPDSDSDGFADDYDECPDVPGLSMIAAIGCADSDGDGLPDDYDLYPGPHGGTAEDFDGDGVPNIQDDFEFDRTQFQDSDGDGRGDNITAGATTPDLFPNQAGAWDDSDGDGWTDQLNNEFTDDCPSIPGDSEIPWRGCPDIDDDGIMDLADEDADGDGISNTLELQAGGAEAIAYDIYKPESVPPDIDGDGMPDSLDEDTDGDGFPDDLEEERGSDPMDSNVTPLNMYGSEAGFYYVPGEGFSSTYSSDGIELSASWAVALATSEYLGMLLLLPLSVLMLMRKSLRYKKMKRRLETLDEPDEIDDFEDEIDELIGKGKVKVEHGLLLRNLFERTRDELSSMSMSTPLAERPSYAGAADQDSPTADLPRGPPRTRGPPPNY